MSVVARRLWMRLLHDERGAFRHKSWWVRVGAHLHGDIVGMSCEFLLGEDRDET